MGIRSTTKIIDERGITLVNIYRQYDGDLDGHGQELAKFLQGKEMINGINGQSMAQAANGMGCLAAQIVAHFKVGIGGFYLESPNATEDFDYEVKLVKGELEITVREDGDAIFKGSPSEFLDAVN